ncbi:MAG: RloB family protein [Pseudomonadota bacterium]
MPKARKKSNKPLPPVLHIYCEGGKTEPNYLNGYIKKYHEQCNRRLIKIEKSKKNTPKELVIEAIKNKTNAETPKVDIFWVVYDRESVADYSNHLHKQALDKANANSVNIALTNVCFEVWILLHMTYSTADYNCCGDFIKKSQLRNKLKEKGVAKYEKGDILVFDNISGEDGVNKARANAEKMNKSTIQASPQNNNKPYLLNPYTDMHKLLDAIDNFIKHP